MFLIGNKSLQMSCLKQHKQKELRKQTLSNFSIDCFVFHFLWSFSLRFFFLFFDCFDFQRNSLCFLWESFLTFIFIQKINCECFFEEKQNVFFIFFCFWWEKMYYSLLYLFSTLKQKRNIRIKMCKKSGKFKTLNVTPFSDVAPIFLGLYNIQSVE